MEQSKGLGRVDWVDYSKGFCIVAVVCLYATQFIETKPGAANWMSYWVEFARPFRMPDFFLIAGLFLSRTIDCPWRKYLDRKVLHFFYFFLLWTTIYFFFTGAKHKEQINFLTYAIWYFDPFHMLWFIEMLPAFFLVTRMTRWVPWFVMLSVGVVLQIHATHPELGMINNFAARYVYFYAGYALAPLVFLFADWVRASLWRNLLLLAVWAVAEEAIVASGWSAAPGISLILGFVGAGAVVACGCLFARTPLTLWLRELGQNSLVVFLSFYLFLIFAKYLLRMSPIEDLGTLQLLATALSVAGPMLLLRLVRGTPLRFFYERPDWARLGGRRVIQAEIVPEEPGFLIFMEQRIRAGYRRPPY